MTPTATPLRSRVEHGMRFLDVRSPGWRDQISLDTLNLASASNCICGQLFGANGYTQIVNELTPPDRRGDPLFEHPGVASAYGFCGPYEQPGDCFCGPYDGSDPLTAEWKRAIREGARLPERELATA